MSSGENFSASRSHRLRARQSSPGGYLARNSGGVFPWLSHPRWARKQIRPVLTPNHAWQQEGGQLLALECGKLLPDAVILFQAFKVFRTGVRDSRDLHVVSEVSEFHRPCDWVYRQSVDIIVVG